LTVHGVQPRADGGYHVRLEPEEQTVLRELSARLEELVATEDEAARRLFPPAYRDAPEEEADYQRLVHSSLASGRVQALRTLRATAGATHLSQADADAWCGALNDLRLVLGDRLGVTEELYETGIEPDHPKAYELTVYGWLTWLQGTLVDALASRLDGPR
jgi:hypothetical protein